MTNGARDRIDLTVEKVGDKITVSIDPEGIIHPGCCSCCNWWWDLAGVVRQLEGGGESKT
jgi:hypothetical protein